ncbi:Protein of unknown function [Ekhidna lutea]|uniref:DUF3108 domain-containing protein n=1 Tax=Ekhidna lutea TaxID=447679 RepID=A0A239H5L3_EKHLU|nr:DUF3108 domain-containing protein [Ekhidna lutea]SNS76660.1 Protein of unknown function [Ekhidna lutea]
MKTIALLLLGGLLSNAQVVENKPVSKGEELQFKLSYGWFTIGRGTFQVSNKYIERDGRECIEINVAGKTAGLAGVFSKVDDKWGAVIDKNTFRPYYSYRDLSEGDYELEEEVFFDYDSMNIRFEQTSPTEPRPRPTRFYELEKDNVFDMMGGLMYARSLDYRNMKKGDTIQLDAFFDKKFYDFEMVYHGIEMVNTKVGEINCHKVVPIMEKNSVFVGKDAVTFWVSADANRLPLRVSANMKFGTAYCELTSYKNVKSGIDFE